MTIHVEIGEKLEYCKHLDDISSVITKSRKVVIVTGAGISSNAGIPDFRSADGLFSSVKKQYPSAMVKGKDMFDAIMFSNSHTTSLFYCFMMNLREKIVDAHPTITHKFIKMLKEKKKLLRCYTQNIDNLEKNVGMSVGTDKSKDVVQLHGDIHTLRCTLCNSISQWENEHKNIIQQNNIPDCKECKTREEIRTSLGKRSHGVGILRPDIVLYGEEHPYSKEIGITLSKDSKSNPDCLLIFGTSLRVNGIKMLVKDLAKSVHAKSGKVIFINNDKVAGSTWDKIIDYHVQSDCDKWIEDLKQRKSRWFERQSSLNDFAKVKKQPKSQPIPKTQNPKKRTALEAVDLNIELNPGDNFKQSKETEKRSVKRVRCSRKKENLISVT